MSEDKEKELLAKEAELFSKFISTRKILVADANAAARSSLFNLLKEMGAKSAQLSLANTYEAAEQQIAETKPHVVIAEYNFGKHCGLELLRSQREQRPAETKDCLFVIVTSDTSQSAAARALEEDIDAYIIKPYTLEFVRRTLIKAAIQKIKPPKYFQVIEQGKAAMAEGKYDEAEAFFKGAVELDPAPSLAYYYLGQLKYLREILAQAQANYMKGLKFNNIHYKCLVGMYDLLMKEQRHVEAYDIVRKIAKYFPANPKRLSEVMRLAIINGKYEDIESYYRLFINLDQRNATLIRYTTAAMVVCGKYYLSVSQTPGKAVDIFQKAAATSGNAPKILAEIIPSLLDYNHVEEAEKFLQKFPPETRKSPEFLIMELLVTDLKGSFSLTIDKGRELLSQGIKDHRLYELMLLRSQQAGLESAVEDLLMDATTAYPERKQAFEQVLAKAKLPIPGPKR